MLFLSRNTMLTTSHSVTLLMFLLLLSTVLPTHYTAHAHEAAADRGDTDASLTGKSAGTIRAAVAVNEGSFGLSGDDNSLLGKTKEAAAARHGNRGTPTPSSQTDDGLNSNKNIRRAAAVTQNSAVAADTPLVGGEEEEDEKETVRVDYGPIITKQAKAGLVVVFVIAGLFTLLVLTEVVPAIGQWCHGRKQRAEAEAPTKEQGDSSE